ncbi:MAG TPA: hypothetical protein VIH57_08045 [Bacteroidales bacterium]
MEVHHHPKHSDKPRKYKEYLFEFLVIFIAIIGSFFAENIREHNIERHREKEYMRSMLQDLRTDSANLTSIIAKNKQQISGLDSLLGVMNNKLTGEELKQFYILDLKYTLNYNALNPVNRTISQLMNTGGLSLIKKKNVSDGIVGYNEVILVVLKQTELLENRFTKILDQQSDIVDLQEIVRLKHGSPIQQLTEFPDLLTSDKKTLHSYYFNIISFKGAIDAYTQRLREVLKQNMMLFELIRKEYRLKDM